MKRATILGMCLAVAAVGATAAAARASSQFMNINFDADTIGAAPSTGPAGTPITKVQAIGGYNSDPLPISDPGYQSPPTADCGTIAVGNVAGMSKAAVMTTNSTDGEMGALWMDTGFAVTSSQLTLGFSLNVLSAPAPVYDVQPKYLNNTADRAGILFGINTFGSAGRLMFAVAPTSDTGGVFALRSPDNTQLITFGNYVNGQAYDITLSADFTTNKVDTYINGVETMSGFQFLAGGPSATSTTSEVFMFLNGQQGYSNQVAIDNIAASPTAVPLPAAAWAGMTLLGGLASFRVFRSRRAQVV